MRRCFFLTLFTLLVVTPTALLHAASYYPEKPEDPRAVYFTKDNFTVHGDGVGDDSDALQEAVSSTRGGIVFIPEGRYRITKTIIVGGGVRLIGYGKRRPVIVLPAHTPSFQWGTGKYMFHFAQYSLPSLTPKANLSGRGRRSGFGRAGEIRRAFSDASETTFFSGMDNIDIEIQEGNLAAIAVRFHVAQHCYLRHMDFNIGTARAAVEDIGNQISDVTFRGGKYGIITKRTAPVWPFLLMDSHFEGQSEAGIQTMEAGFTMVRVSFENMPVAIQVTLGEVEQLYGRDLQMKNITWAGFKHGNAENLHSAVTFTNVACSDVPTFYRGDEVLRGSSQHYVMDQFSVGLDIGADGREKGVALHHKKRTLTKPAPPVPTDIPALPPMSEWVNVHTLGITGDADVTKALKKAIETHKTLYFPMGQYRISEPIRLKKDTAIIGLHPFRTLFSVQGNAVDSEKPVGAIIAPKGGKNIVCSISVTPGPYAGILWMAGPDSLMDDVSFAGNKGRSGDGFGGRSDSGRTKARNPDIWVTNGGGGIFRGDWPHGISSSEGFVIENTKTKGKIYQMSVEHHYRVELDMKNVENWEFYALQTEEEYPAGHTANAMLMDACKNILFANTYMYRVSRSLWPTKYGMVISDSDDIVFENMKVFSQTRLAFDAAVYHTNSGVEARQQFFTNFAVTKDLKAPKPLALPDTIFAKDAKVEKLATGYRNATGLTTDSKGNLYYADDSNRKVYKLNASDKKVELLAEIRDSQPMVLAFVEPSTLLMVARESKVLALDLSKKNAVPKTITGVPEAQPDTKLLIPMGIHNMMSVLDDLMDHRDYIYRHYSNTAVVSVLENSQRDYFYAPGTKTAVKAGGTWRPLPQSSNMAAFAPGDIFYVACEDDGKTYRVKLNKNETLAYCVFAERGGTAAVEDAAGNVYVASDQIYIYNSKGEQIGVLEVPERPGSLAFGGLDSKTLYIGARTSLYSVSAVNPGRNH